jgi:hypothetical protein
MVATPEANSCFVLVIQGTQPWAGVVEGIEGVREALMRILWSDPEHALIKDVATAIASLEDPSAWATHGSGDGRPYWHWWLGYEGGSVTVQRLTERPSSTTKEHVRSALEEVTGVLTDLAGELRKLARAERSEYVFARRDRGQDR